MWGDKHMKLHPLVGRITTTLAFGTSLLISPMPSALAQTDDTPIEEVTVIGTRLANQRAIDAKRNADRIVDSVATDDLANLPDFSVSESLRRVPGISTTDRNGDAEFVTVRGLRSDLNYLTIDGASLPSTSNGRTEGNASRGTQLSIVPSSLVSRVDVVKSFTADLDANVIGGAFDLRTRSAFDQEDTLFVTSFSLAQYANDDGPRDTDLPIRGRVSYAQSFGDQDQVGVVLAGSYSSEEYYTYLPGVAYDFWRFYEPDGSANYYSPLDAPDGTYTAPMGVQAYQYQIQRERKSLYGKLEYQPTDRLYMALSAFNFVEDDSEDRWDTIIYRFDGSDFRDNHGDTPENLTATTGTAHRGYALTQYYEFGPKIDASSVVYRLNFELDDRQSLRFLANVGSAENNEPVDRRRFDTGGAKTALAWNYDISGDYPIVDLVDSTFYDDLTNLTSDRYEGWFNGNEQDQREVKLDYAFEPLDFGFGYKLGISYKNDERNVDYHYFRYNPTGPDAQAFTQSDANLDTAPFESLGNLPVHFIDGAAFDAFFNQTLDQWTRTTSDEDFAWDDQKNDYTISEDILAGYAEANWRTEDLYAYVGVRYETTDLDSSGYKEIDGVRGPASVSNDFNNALPSFGLNYDVSDNFKARFAFSKTLGRQDYYSIRVNGSQTIFNDPEVDPVTGELIPGSISAAAGNPALKPREADNYDLSFEYYMDEFEGALSVAVFYKELENEIFNSITKEEVDLVAGPYILTTRTPLNAESASLSGIELGLRFGSLSFISEALDNFGVNLNYSYIDSNVSVLRIDSDDNVERVSLYGLERQPREIYNASVTWSPGPFSATLAYKYRGRNLVNVITSAESAWEEAFYDERESLDMKFRYKFSDHLNFFGEARNMSDTKQDRIIPAVDDRIHWSREYGRSYWVGLTYKM